MTGEPRTRDLRVEHHDEALGIGEAEPRVSWRIDAEPGWRQRRSQLRIERADGEVEIRSADSTESVLTPWPFGPLRSRERVLLQVRAAGDDGAWTAWSAALPVEAGLLDPGDWTAAAVAPAWHEDTAVDNPPPLLRRSFDLPGEVAAARLYVTAHGLYEVEINGERVGREALAPGWTVYGERLRYATYDVTAALRSGGNVIGAWLADGWYRGRYGFDGGTRNLYGDRLALLAQLEVTFADGSTTSVVTDGSWLAALGPIRLASLYDGEHYDATMERPGWSGGAGRFDPEGWTPVEVVARDPRTLVAPDGPPVRATEELVPVSVLAQDDGRLLIDFGQNIAGRLRLTVRGPRGRVVRIRHAEVLQEGRIYTRPLRDAAATDEYVLRGGAEETWEPHFTVHGFRYAEVEGWTGDDPAASIRAVVHHSDFARTGWFECSDERVNRLHENVVWSMRGNMVDIPTDCPQRDERLGWTGDIQVFAPTASFLFDCSGFLTSWLKDLAVEQLSDGTVPWYVPVIPGGDWWTPIRPGAVWGDVAVLTPWTLWERFADREVLARQYDSAKAWVDLVDRLSDEHLWRSGRQLGDWLDPAAPPEDPAAARTDRHLVATAYAAWSARRLADTAVVLGRAEDAEHYGALSEAVADAFRKEYVLPEGRLTSDAPTAYALAIVFGLVVGEDRAAAGDRLAELMAEAGHTVATGFAGTPVVSEALSATGHGEDAYALLLQEACPSWLYAVAMGATTIWERWDSMLRDGTVNPGGMTSFNHYALGAVADWLHRRVAGLEAVEPGYRRVRFRPEPGGGLTWAAARHRSAYGETSVSWRIEGDDDLSVEVTVPTGATGEVHLPGGEVVEVLPGSHRFVRPVRRPGAR